VERAIFLGIEMRVARHDGNDVAVGAANFQCAVVKSSASGRGVIDGPSFFPKAKGGSNG
jgi:hypothetical protein